MGKVDKIMSDIVTEGALDAENERRVIVAMISDLKEFTISLGEKMSQITQIKEDVREVRDDVRTIKTELAGATSRIGEIDARLTRVEQETDSIKKDIETRPSLVKWITQQPLAAWRYAIIIGAVVALFMIEINDHLLGGLSIIEKIMKIL